MPDHLVTEGKPGRDEHAFRVLRNDVASKLDHALTMETRVLALIVVDRESMRWALDEPPTDALAELRGVLLSTRGGYAKGWSETSARARRAAEALGVVLRDNSFEAEVAHSREERLT